MAKSLGRRPGSHDEFWPDRLITLLTAVESIQSQRHTVSFRELERACGVSRQTIANWLKIAADLDYVNLHNGQPRALELLPQGRKLVKRFRSFQDVQKWRRMRKEMGNIVW